MPVVTSFPGVYIQELPSLTHTVVPAQTSVAAFVGYTHPFLTQQFLTALPLMSFSDYQTNFGGFFSSPWLPDYMGQAVYQFFLNGGSNCYVVGLPAQQYYSGGQPIPGPEGPVTVTAASVQVPAGASEYITFTAVQPVGIPAAAPATTGTGIPMQVAISRVRQTNEADDTADIVISYGTAVETYRNVQISNIASALAGSSLVTVQLTDTAPTAFPTTGSPFPLGYPAATTPQAGWTVINPGDFGQVFQDYASLDKVPIFNLLCTPGITDPAVTSEGVAYCERKRAFYLMDTPSPETSGWDANSVVDTLATGGALSPIPPVSINAAVYYPWLQTTDPITGQPITVPPSPFVAGVCAQVDASPGVWQSPAGTSTALLGTTGVDPGGMMTDPQQGVMNENAINCLRQFQGTGTVVFGARTTAGADVNTAQQQWKYVAVRRMALFIEQTFYTNLTWAVFEPNAQPLWDAMALEANAFMLTLFNNGAFAGTTPSQSFTVVCDSTTTTQTDVQNGIANILVGFAPLLPAEFVVVQIAQLAGQAQS